MASESDNINHSGADPENNEPGGAIVLNVSLNRGRKFIFVCLTYKGEQGARAGCAPLISRLKMT